MSLLTDNPEPQAGEQQPAAGDEKQETAQFAEAQPTEQPVKLEWLPEPPEGINPASLAKFKGVGDLAKAYVELEKTFSATRPTIPKSTDPPEVWDKFYETLGRPQTPDDYKLELPPEFPADQYNQEFEADFRRQAHKLGLSAQAVNELHKWYLSKGLSIYQEQMSRTRAEYDQAMSQLKTEWGDQFDKKLGSARRMFRQMSPTRETESAINALAGTPMEIQLIKFFADVAHKLGEDRHVRGEPVKSAGYLERAREKLAELSKLSPTDPFYRKHLTEVERLYREAEKYGEINMKQWS